MDIKEKQMLEDLIQVAYTFEEELESVYNPDLFPHLHDVNERVSNILSELTLLEMFIHEAKKKM